MTKGTCWSNGASMMRMLIIMLRIDLQQAKGTLQGKIIDRSVFALALTTVAAYFMPMMGISVRFGQEMLAGLLASIGMVETYSIIAQIVADLEGDKVISYYLTLPVPASLVFIRMIIYNALFFSVVCLALFPVCNFLLPVPISYASIHWPKFIGIVTLINFFHGAMILWASTLVSDLRVLGKVWARLLHPMWILGGFQFTWIAAYKKASWIGFITLLNPMMHATEALRASLLGQAGYFNFWVASLYLSLMACVMTLHGIARMKRRLDLI